MSGSLLALSLAELRDGLRRREFSATEVAQAYNDAVEQVQPLNAYITPTPERALAMAKAADARLARGAALPLDGVPIAVKDLFCTRDVPTTAASHILDGFRPPYESTVTEKLWRAGAVMLGKTNLDEFAMGSSNTTSWYGPAVNPWQRKGHGGDNRPLVSGGSSGGSAAAVAAHAAAAATGTDTGGSIRQPAAHSGVSGLKPTYGAVSRYGLVAYASSLDQAGPIAKSAADLALVMNAMAGFDPRDSTSVERPKEDYSRHLGERVAGLRIGLPREYFGEGVAPGVRRAVDEAVRWFEREGARTVPVELPNAKLGIPAYYVIAPAEASSNLARFDGVRYGHRASRYTDLADMYGRTRAEGFGAEVKRRILVGTYVLSHGYYDAYYLQAQKVRRLIARDFLAAFERCDVVFGPTAPSTAFEIGAKSDDPVEM
ncbi:MAG TPA: Asp-tRNA(Asn)/Glu-tRNA(Gln) amidotransferase subunit GatA, partial [Stellaceae bacterium]|nr:Asp-tRNA(Asn)/Glu-tRNA(Gln) amidotransferase subunit GatA [Stellaceae bacterium]